MSDHPRRIRIQDIAREAGVSVATVSRVIRHSRRVNPETCARVEEVVRRLHYSPSRLARRLRDGAASLVGVVVPDIANPYFMQLVRGCEDAARGMEISVIVASTDEDPERESQQVQAILEHTVDQVILAPTIEADAAVDLLRTRGVPFVLVDRDVTSGSAPCVLNDDEGAIRRLVDVLVTAGHGAIGVVTGPESTYTGRIRANAARTAIEEQGLRWNATWAVTADYRDGSSYGKILQLLQQPDRPTAVIAGSNVIARDILRTARLLHMDVPQDLSLVAIADPYSTELAHPRLTIAQQDPATIGSLAMRLLQHSGRDGGGHAPRLLVPAPLVPGDSVAAPPVGSGREPVEA